MRLEAALPCRLGGEIDKSVILFGGKPPGETHKGVTVHGGETDKTVVLYTSMGEVEVELYWKHAPRTCKNFYELAKRGYYDNTLFHRIVTDFVIQGGRVCSARLANHRGT